MADSEQIQRKRRIQRKSQTQSKSQAIRKPQTTRTRQIRRSSSIKPNPEIQARIDAIQVQISQLQGRVELTAISEEIGRIEERLSEYPVELKALQRRGFVHSRQLEERLQLLDGQWAEISPRLRSSLRQHRSRLKSDMANTSRQVNRAQSGQPSALSNAESAVEGLNVKIDAAERALKSQFSNVDGELYIINRNLNQAKWMMDALEASPEIRLRAGEGPLLAVESEWQRDVDEGPKGVLYITDQRLLFEQKEEIVTKKRFGIFKAESEMVHKLWLDINIGDIASAEDSEEGGFLGIGKADILELTCSGQAPISRARFHLKGQESSAWRAEIRRVQTGITAGERSDDGETSVEYTFPTQCPNCLATLPVPHRGANRVTCEFCGTVVLPG